MLLVLVLSELFSHAEGGRRGGCVRFANRPKALAHLQDACSRGGATSTCKEIVLRGVFEQFPDEVVKRLDAEDRKLRTEARKLGWTQPRSLARARRATVRAVPVGPPEDHMPCKRSRAKAPVFAGTWKPKRLRCEVTQT